MNNAKQKEIECMWTHVDFLFSYDLHFAFQLYYHYRYSCVTHDAIKDVQRRLARSISSLKFTQTLLIYNNDFIRAYVTFSWHRE